MSERKGERESVWRFTVIRWVKVCLEGAKMICGERKEVKGDKVGRKNSIK